jgi:uncharacterized protein Yka (UPF0111/DUF47 family)
MNINYELINEYKDRIKELEHEIEEFEDKIREEHDEKVYAFKHGIIKQILELFDIPNNIDHQLYLGVVSQCEYDNLLDQLGKVGE